VLDAGGYKPNILPSVNPDENLSSVQRIAFSLPLRNGICPIKQKNIAPRFSKTSFFAVTMTDYLKFNNRKKDRDPMGKSAGSGFPYWAGRKTASMCGEIPRRWVA